MTEAVFPEPRIPGYVIRRPLCAGAQGTAWLAVQQALDRLVVVKTLHPTLAEDPACVQRFLREGRVAARLSHENLVTVHDAGNQGEFYYLVMEYVDGESLRDRLHREGRLPIPEALRVLRDLARALHCLEKAKLVHRDVKPANVLFAKDGTVKLADFGLVGGLAAGVPMTAKGAAIGTLGYMSPEQLRGNARVDVRSDLFGLGATAYHALTGKEPFPAADLAVLVGAVEHGVMRSARELRDDVSPAADSLLRRMMAARPEARPSSARLVAEEADRLLSTKPPTCASAQDETVSLADVTAPMPEVPSRRRWVVAAVSVVVVLVLGMVLWKMRRPKVPPVVPPTPPVAAPVKEPFRLEGLSEWFESFPPRLDPLLPSGQGKGPRPRKRFRLTRWTCKLKWNRLDEARLVFRSGTEAARDWCVAIRFGAPGGETLLMFSNDREVSGWWTPGKDVLPWEAPEEVGKDRTECHLLVSEGRLELEWNGRKMFREPLEIPRVLGVPMTVVCEVSRGTVLAEAELVGEREP